MERIGKRRAMVQGGQIIPAGTIATQYFESVEKVIARMVKITVRDVMALDDAFAMDGDEAFAMDASIASQARILTNALRERFAQMFAKIATPVAERMANSVKRDSALKVKSSLKDVAQDLTLKWDDSLADIYKSTVAVNVDLIKSIPERYLDQVQGSVMRSIQSGRGLADLQPALLKYGETSRNWAKNVSLDQTRKAYNGVAAARLQQLGCKKFKWCHSGGSNHPRKYHRDVLNGKIFRFDDLPHLDGPNEGEKGLPGQAIYCRCFMKPVFTFDEDGDE